MNVIQKLQKKKAKYVVGLMSGTSADGVDAALVHIHEHGVRTHMHLIAHVRHPYPKGFREHLLANSQSGASSVDEIARLNGLVGELFADAVARVARSVKMPLSVIDLIGSHGQTVHHLPQSQKMFGKEVKATLQIGDPSVIAVRTGIPTVGDFRTADVAAGGQGAPLVPYFDHLLFQSRKLDRVILNVGGIANATFLKEKGSLDQVRAFDTGPGNMLIDAYCKQKLGVPFDIGGAMAAHGEVQHGLLNRLMHHPFLTRKPPKSTGREEFGEQYLAKILKTAKRISSLDVLATLTEFSALSIYDAIKRFGGKGFAADEVIVSGGGVYNTTMMRSLAVKLAPTPLIAIDEFGIPSDAKESMLMAVLANETIHEVPSNIPAVTGAKKRVVLGKICQ